MQKTIKDDNEFKKYFNINNIDDGLTVRQMDTILEKIGASHYVLDIYDKVVFYRIDITKNNRDVPSCMYYIHEGHLILVTDKNR